MVTGYVSGYDVLLLIVGAVTGQVVFDRRLPFGFFRRLFMAFPCYDVILFQVDRMLHITQIVVVGPAQVSLFFMGVGYIFGGTISTIVNLLRSALQKTDTAVGGYLTNILGLQMIVGKFRDPRHVRTVVKSAFSAGCMVCLSVWVLHDAIVIAAEATSASRSTAVQTPSDTAVPTTGLQVPSGS